MSLKTVYSGSCGFAGRKKSAKAAKRAVFALIKYTAIPFLCILLVFKPLIPVVDYLVHYHYYAKVLCINKDKPMMHCNGMCQLSKEMAKTTETSNEANTSTPVKIVEMDVFIVSRIIEISTQPVRREENGGYRESLYSFIFSRSLLKPPAVSLS